MVRPAVRPNFGETKLYDIKLNVFPNIGDADPKSVTGRLIATDSPPVFYANLEPEVEIVDAPGGVATPGKYKLHLSNTWSLETTLILEGSSAKDQCDLLFGNTRVVVGPGQSVTVPVTVTPKLRIDNYKDRSYPFDITVYPERWESESKYVEGELKVSAPKPDFRLDLIPIEPVGPAAKYDMFVTNYGHADLGITLSAFDHEELLEIEFERTELHVHAGERRRVPVTVNVVDPPPDDRPSCTTSPCARCRKMWTPGCRSTSWARSQSTPSRRSTR